MFIHVSHILSAGREQCTLHSEAQDWERGTPCRGISWIDEQFHLHNFLLLMWCDNKNQDICSKLCVLEPEYVELWQLSNVLVGLLMNLGTCMTHPLTVTLFALSHIAKPMTVMSKRWDVRSLQLSHFPSRFRSPPLLFTFVYWFSGQQFA